MKYVIQLVVAAVFVVAGFFVYTNHRAETALKERHSNTLLAMEQNFSLMMNGWDFNQAQMLFGSNPDLGELAAQLDYIREDFGSCRLNAGYTCSTPTQANDTVFCSFSMTCEKAKGIGEVNWMEHDGMMKVYNFRVRRQ